MEEVERADTIRERATAASRDSLEKFKSMARRALEANSFPEPFPGSSLSGELRLTCLNRSIRNVEYQSLKVIDVGGR